MKLWQPEESTKRLGDQLDAASFLYAGGHVTRETSFTT